VELFEPLRARSASMRRSEGELAERMVGRVAASITMMADTGGDRPLVA
jgi:hypothetical protein